MAARRHGKVQLTWTAYVLYGDPTTRYVTATAENPGGGRPAVLPRKRLIALLGSGGAAVAVVAVASTSRWVAPAAGRTWRRLQAPRGRAPGDATREFESA